MCSTVFFAVTVVFCAGLQEINAASARLPLPPPQDKIQWPKSCEKKTFCMLNQKEVPENYPTKNFKILLPDMEIDLTPGLVNRSSDDEDVAGCMSTPKFNPIYMIKDNNNMVRFVANTDSFKFIIGIEECTKPGLVLWAPHLKESKLLQKRCVYCYEKKEPIMFPVLSLDGQRIESVAPKGGIPLSCSAKIMTTRQ